MAISNCLFSPTSENPRGFSVWCILVCFVDQKYGDYQRNIDLMIEHAYYHLGQILILKKLLNKRKINR